MPEGETLDGVYVREAKGLGHPRPRSPRAPAVALRTQSEKTTDTKDPPQTRSLAIEDRRRHHHTRRHLNAFSVLAAGLAGLGDMGRSMGRNRETRKT